MRWDDEPFVKIYTRDTPEFLALSWQARCLLHELIRKVDHAGILKVGRLGLKGVAIAMRAPYEEIVTPLRELLEDGRLVFREDRGQVIVPNHVAAQTSRQTDRARKERSRSLAAGAALADESHAVTRGHTESRDVTLEEKREERREETSEICRAREEQEPCEEQTAVRLRPAANPELPPLPPPEDVPISDDLMGRCAMAGYPKPTKAHVLACLTNARLKGKLSRDWTGEVFMWMSRAKQFERTATGARSPPARFTVPDTQPAPYHALHRPEPVDMLGPENTHAAATEALELLNAIGDGNGRR